MRKHFQAAFLEWVDDLLFFWRHCWSDNKIKIDQLIASICVNLDPS